MDNKTKIQVQNSYESYYKDLYRYAFSLLGNKEDAEDSVQEIFKKLVETIESYRYECSLKTWLFTLIRNNCYDRLKRKKIFTSESEISINSGVFNTSSGIEIKLTFQEALKILTTEQNELIFLKDFAGYSYKEISEITGNSLDNVKIKLFRTREKLKKFIRESEEP